MTSDPLLSLLLGSSTENPPAEDSMLGMQIRRVDKQSALGRFEKMSSHQGETHTSGNPRGPRAAVVLGSGMIVSAYLLSHSASIEQLMSVVRANESTFFFGILAVELSAIGYEAHRIMRTIRRKC